MYLCIAAATCNLCPLALQNLAVSFTALRVCFGAAQIVPVMSNVSWANVNVLALYCTEYKALFGSVNLKEALAMKMPMSGARLSLLAQAANSVIQAFPEHSTASVFSDERFALVLVSCVVRIRLVKAMQCIMMRLCCSLGDSQYV